MKFKRLFAVFALLFVLTSCNVLNQNKQGTIDQVYKEVIDNIQIPSIVYQDIILPKTHSNGATLSWISDKPEALDSEGTVYRTDEDVFVILTLEVTYKNESKPKTYRITVAKDDEHYTYEDVFDEINIPSFTDKDLVLPTTHRIEGIFLNWKSNHEDILSSGGKVTQTDKDVLVTLTLEVKIDEITNIKIYQVMVLKIGLKAPETLDFMTSITDFELEKFGKSGLPSKGSYSVLVIPVEIAGFTFPRDYKEKLEIAFNGTSSQTGFESVSSYYKESSYGYLDLNFDIVDKYQATQTKLYYENKRDDADQIIMKETLTALDDHIDFSKYDVNQDRTIDAVIFIYSVDYDAKSEDTAWWAWVFNAGNGAARDLKKLDGKTFEYYMWASYQFLTDDIPGSDVIVNAETYIHELGHLLGFPDLYSQTEDYGPLGGWDMMDANTGDHGPLNKLLFGWIKPTLLTKGTYEVNLEDYSTDTDGIGNVILIPHKNSNLKDGDAFDEYLLIVSYSPRGLYETYLNTNLGLSKSGIAIYHVDARLASGNIGFWDNYFMQDNNDKTNFFVRLLEADKNQSLPGNKTIAQSDLLEEGSLDLRSYRWNQKDIIDVKIEIMNVYPTFSGNASLRITV